MGLVEPGDFDPNQKDVAITMEPRVRTVNVTPEGEDSECHPRGGIQHQAS